MVQQLRGLTLIINQIMNFSILASRVQFEGNSKASWDDLCNNYPWCSQQYKLDSSRQIQRNQLLAAIFASYIDSLICDFQYAKLETVISIENIPNEFEKPKHYLEEIQASYLNFIRPLKPLDSLALSNIKSQNEKTKIIKNYLEAQRNHIFQYLINNYNELASMTRALALIVFLSHSYSHITQIEELITKFSLDSIVNSLITGQSNNEKQSIFLIEDYELIPIVFHIKRSIYIYVNNPDLIKKSTANKEDPDPIVILLEKPDRLTPPSSIRILSNSNMKFYQEKHIQKISKPKLEQIEETQNLAQALLDHMVQQFEEQVEFWLEQMDHMVQDPSMKLGRKKAQASIEKPLLALREFSQKFDFSQKDSFSIKKFLDDSLLQSFNRIDNYLNKSVTLTSSQIRSYFHRKSFNSDLDIISRKSNVDVFLKIDLFFKIKERFSQQKQYNQHRIEAKNLVEDIPDPIENQTEMDIKKINPFANYVIEESPFENENFVEEHSIRPLEKKSEEKVEEKKEIILEKRKQSNLDYDNIPENDIKSVKSERQPIKIVQSNSAKHQKSAINNGPSNSQSQQIFLVNQFEAKSVQEVDNLSYKSDIRVHSNTRKVSFKYVPNNQKKSDNLLKHIEQSKKIKKRSYSFDKGHNGVNKITETDEVNQSVLLEFLCPFCYNTITSEEEIKQIHGDHKICQDCLENWIKAKFNAGQWNLKSFFCPILNSSNQHCMKPIDKIVIKSVLTEEEYEKMMETMKQVNSTTCPWCAANFEGVPVFNKEGFSCPECNSQICQICKQIINATYCFRQKEHDGKQCPDRLQDIIMLLQDERIACCPVCLEIFLKNDGCLHVKCHKCSTEFCFGCSAERDPIMNHGAHYHRVGCESYKAWVNPETNEEILDDDFEPEVCARCLKSQVGCKRPLDLASFKNLLHLN